MFVSIKPLHVLIFFHDHLQGVLCCALCHYYSSRWFAFVLFVLLRSMWPHVYVNCVRLVFLSVGDKLVNGVQFTSRWPTDKNTKHAQMTYTCGHILCNNTNSMNANQREKQQRHKAQWRTPLKMVVKKKPKHVGVLYLQTRF